MMNDPDLLIVGGTGRNVGKTEFTCRLIKKISAHYPVFALKVSAIFPDEQLYHGDHSGDQPAGSLFEETRRDTPKDTSRMLRAGADRVFFLRSDDAGIESSYREFREIIPASSIVVCESNSLGQYVQPGLLIMVKTPSGLVKPRAIGQLNKADLVITSDRISGFPGLEKISYHSIHHWHLIHSTKS